MDKDHSRAIVYLLGAILAVLLFGASAFLSGIGWAIGIGAALGVIFLIFKGAKAAISGFRDEVRHVRELGQTGISVILLFMGVAGAFIVVCMAAVQWIGGDVRFRAAMVAVPYWWVAPTLMFGGVLATMIETASDWVPKVALGWLSMAAAPVLAPRKSWLGFKKRRAGGERVGWLSLAFVLMFDVLLGIVLSCIAILPVMGILVALFGK